MLIRWSGIRCPTQPRYTLQEDDNASFSSPTTAYSGTGTSLAVSSKPAGTYYYRVKAANTYGDSPWSTTRSTTVASASNLPLAGFWESTTGDEFYVTTDRSNVDDFAIYINITGCGSYKITHTTPVPIASNQFAFTGSFYASGTFNSTTSASGQDGLNNYSISGCGTVNGGPWSWTASWQSAALASEPQTRLGTVVDENGVTRTALITVTHSAQHAIR